jgi:hypothetical protein
MVVVGSRFIDLGSFLKRVLGTVLRDDRGILPYLLVSWVIVQDFIRIIGFLISTFGFYFERLLPISMETTPIDAGVVFLFMLFWTVLSCIL